MMRMRRRISRIIMIPKREPRGAQGNDRPEYVTLEMVIKMMASLPGAKVGDKIPARTKNTKNFNMYIRVGSGCSDFRGLATSVGAGPFVFREGLSHPNQPWTTIFVLSLWYLAWSPDDFLVVVPCGPLKI